MAAAACRGHPVFPSLPRKRMSKNRALKAAAFAALLVLTVYLLRHTALIGDGGEYLLTTHALFRHGTVFITAGDFSDYLQRDPADLARIGFYPQHFAELAARFRQAQPTPWAGFASVHAGQACSIHFWLYSLFALPFYAVLYPAGLNPLLALTAVNVGAVAVFFGYARAAWGRFSLLATVFLLACGTTFYLTWTGPEVLSAVCVLICCLAICRRDFGAAMLAAGIGAAQNPSIVLLMPVALLAHPRLAAAACAHAVGVAGNERGADDLAVPRRRGAGTGRRHRAVRVVQGALRRVQPDRQVFHPAGIYVGRPPGFAVLRPRPGYRRRRARPVHAAARVRLPGRTQAAARLAGTGGLTALAVTLLMAVPTLSAINWNSGGRVLSRYGYWLVMPLLAACLAAMKDFGARARIVCILAMGLPQAVVYSQAGITADDWRYTRHTRWAEWALAHLGAHYNPDPEIFYERTHGDEVEAPLDPRLAQLFSAQGVPLKALANQAHPAPSFGLCGAGYRLRGSQRVQLAHGWYYEHAPFGCEKLPVYAPSLAFRFRDRDADTGILSAGWSTRETKGVWTNARRSVLEIRVPPTERRLRLRFSGQYYYGQNRTLVSLNGTPLQQLDLSEGVIETPKGAAATGAIRLELAHPTAASPLQRGESADERLIAFYLRELYVDLEQ
jgi:hypothetical protein